MNTYHEDERRTSIKKSSTAGHLWSLQKDGRQIACLLADLESGAFELKLTWSDKQSRSVQIFRIREEAIAEAEHHARDYMDQGWAPQRDQR